MIEDGSAVALVAGAYEDSSTDLYLPLDSPLRVLHALRSEQKIPRGLFKALGHWKNLQTAKHEV